MSLSEHKKGQHKKQKHVQFCTSMAFFPCSSVCMAQSEPPVESV